MLETLLGVLLEEEELLLDNELLIDELEVDDSDTDDSELDDSDWVVREELDVEALLSVLLELELLNEEE